MALASLFSDGYAAARPAIHRALQKCLTRFPQNVAMLVVAVAAHMQEEQHEMSARQYLSLAMRLFADEAREEVFVMLLKMDGDPEVPYPLRNVHQLVPYPSSGPHATDASKANALVTIGCWGPAGRAFARLAEQEPQNAGLWQNVALCRAWDGDEIGAAEAFHRAAELSSDAPFAVECETLAQLCNLKTSADGVPLREIHFPIRSASRLLGVLDSDDHLTRAPQPKQEEGDELSVAAEYIVRSKPLPTEAELGHLSPDDYPFVAATLTIFDANPAHGQEAAVYLRGYAGEAFDSALALVERLAKDESAGPTTSEIDDSSETVPREQLPFFRAWQLPPQTPAAMRNSLIDARWRHLIDDFWFNTPQAALGGKSPAQAKDNPADRVRLAAAVYVLDALVQRLRGRLDFDELLRRLNLDVPEPIDPATVTLSALSPMQLHRLPISKLTDAQLVYTQRRATLVGHRRFVQTVLREIVTRPQCLAQVDANRVYYNLVDIAQVDGRLDEAIAWSREAKERASKSKDQGAFERDPLLDGDRVRPALRTARGCGTSRALSSARRILCPQGAAGRRPVGGLPPTTRRSVSLAAVVGAFGGKRCGQQHDARRIVDADVGRFADSFRREAVASGTGVSAHARAVWRCRRGHGPRSGAGRTRIGLRRAESSRGRGPR